MKRNPSLTVLAASICGCLLGSTALQLQAATFTDVTAGSGISGGAGSWSGVWADFDEDGDLDLFTTGHLQPFLGGKNQLWRNNGDRTFTDITVEVGMISDKIDTHSAVWADFDVDGDLDIYLVNETITDKPELWHELWQNNGDGTFQDVAESAGVLGFDHITRGLGAADYDRDGKLDIFVVGWETPFVGFLNENLLFRNQGGMTFTDNAPIAGVEHPEGAKRTMAWMDYNNDNHPDFLLMPPCALYQNQGNGTFTEVGLAAGIESHDQCQAAAWGDYNQDGNMDVYISRGFDAEVADKLYQNNGDGTFTDVTVAAGIDNAPIARAATWGDYDNDGDQDLYVNNFLNISEANVLYRNEGNGTFTDVATEEGAAPSVGGGGSDASFVDYDSDGDVDLFLTNGEGNTTGPYVLLENGGNTNNWMEIGLFGRVSNPDAIMTRMEIQSASRTQYFVHTGPAHFMSQSNAPVHMGLGSDEAVDRILLTWPSGIRQRIENIAANQRFTIPEGQPLWLGQPKLNRAGFYVWQGASRWRILWAGTPDGRQYSGRITSNGTISSVRELKMEADDTVTTGANFIEFSANEAIGFDSIDFAADGSELTFELFEDGVAQPGRVFIGEQRLNPGSLPMTLRR